MVLNRLRPLLNLPPPDAAERAFINYVLYRRVFMSRATADSPTLTPQPKPGDVIESPFPAADPPASDQRDAQIKQLRNEAARLRMDVAELRDMVDDRSLRQWCVNNAIDWLKASTDKGATERPIAELAGEILAFIKPPPSAPATTAETVNG